MVCQEPPASSGDPPSALTPVEHSREGEAPAEPRLSMGRREARPAEWRGGSADVRFSQVSPTSRPSRALPPRATARSHQLSRVR